MEQLSLNSGPDWTVTGKDGIGGFFFVLSIFFPAVTGIMAGANISGELKDPHRDIPVGTISAVLITTVVYLGMVVVYAGAATRIALTTDMLVAVKISAWGPAVYAGIYAATISSAIASFVGAPRVLQAVAIDNLFPFLVIFKKEGCGREPINGYIVTGLIATVFILIGDLNAIAPLISGFFMITYAFINFACFSASYARSPGWRPSFRFYNKWVALVTAALCIIILFLLNWVSGIITLGIGFGLKKYLEYKDVNPSWGTGSALHAIQYNKALTAIVNMNQTHHIKNYRPQLLVLSGPLEGRQGLQIFSQMLSKSKGIFIYGNATVTPL
jgi:amino acid transporter